MTSFAVSLLSGGLDSTIVTAYAKRQVDHITALTFNYGQKHDKEIQCAQNISKLMNLTHRIIDVPFFREVAWYSALTSPENFQIPYDRSEFNIGHNIPVTYVPLRNTIFIGLAAAFLESKVLHLIESEGVNYEDVKAYLYIAPNAVDYSGYPDCRPEFYDSVRDTIKHGSKLWAEYNVCIQIETPIINFSKAKIVDMGVRLGIPMEYTWSCYNGGDVPCGVCESCIIRSRGFAANGMVDPLMVQLGMD